MNTHMKYFVEGWSARWYTKSYSRAVSFAKKLSRDGETVYVWSTKKKKVLRIYRNGARVL